MSFITHSGGNSIKISLASVSPPFYFPGVAIGIIVAIAVMVALMGGGCMNVLNAVLDGQPAVDQPNPSFVSMN